MARAIPAFPPTMSSRRSQGNGMRRRRRSVVFRTRGDLTKDRLNGLLLAALVVLVQLAWGGVLVYLGVRFL
jgi:hypothetical protein